MNIIDLLGKGYFPKELPPSFSTECFARKYPIIASTLNRLRNSGKPYSECVIYSVPRRYYSRRNLGIPNPFHYSILSKAICDHWRDLNSFYNNSRMSASRPTVDASSKRAIKPLKEYAGFKQDCLIGSYDKLYEAKTDISRFYPTIYTHAIAWALHTKRIAKRRKYDFVLIGNILDKCIRACQSNQTVGIPIGPDTSLVIAEIISSEIDKLIQKKFKGIKGYRYYDDYYFFLSSLEEAEEVIKEFQHILISLNLDMNDEKTEIRKCPIAFESDWAIRIRSFKFRNESKSQQTDINDFFSLAFQFANEYPKDAVLKYAIKRLEYIVVDDKNWDIFESLLLKAVLCEPLIIEDVARILISYKSSVHLNKVKRVLKKIIKLNITKRHSFEVSWALWLSNFFKIKINSNLANLIFESGDTISILLTLDMRKRRLIGRGINLSSLRAELTQESLYEDRWLLTYESIIKKWLIPSPRNLLDRDPFFKKLKDSGVYFYDRNRPLTQIVNLDEIRDRIEEERESYAPDIYGI
jgi:hypothetical protein